MPTSCCFKHCKLSPLIPQSSRVEIKSVIPSSGIGKHKESLLVSWKKNGEAILHPECWTTLLSMARKRSSQTRKRKSPHKTTEDDYVMIQSEKVMIKEANKTIERFDSEEDIKARAIQVADMIQESAHCVFFTGAGISTSAGLGDFRGKGGKWTEQDRGAIDIDGFFDKSDNRGIEGSPKKIMRLKNNCRSSMDNKSFASKVEEDDEEEKEDVSYEELRPTFTHESISKLIHQGRVKYLISQNCDGLHLLSGVPAENISELHGNVFVEKCEKCGKRFERSCYVCDDVADMYLEELSDFGKTDIIKPKFMKKCDTCGLSHRTGRKCDNDVCKGFLMDTIINFGDNLEENILDKAFEMAAACDLMVCLGSTLTVTPANELVDYIKSPQRVVICNRQPTEKDNLCLEKDANGQPLGVRVYGDCDVFMRHLMSSLLGKKQYDAHLESLKGKSVVYKTLRKAASN